jgi:hypothetical protein
MSRLSKLFQKSLLPLTLGVLLLGTAPGCVIVTTGPTYQQAWYDVFGNVCGRGDPRPGCNFYADGSKIQDYEDPYYASNAYYYGVYDYYDSFGYYSTYVGWAWMSPTGIVYDEYGRALNESGSEGDSRDLIADAAGAEQKKIEEAGKEFASRYALSETTGIRIARTLTDWATLSKRQNRARTAEDVADFSKRLFGVSLGAAQKALDAAKTGNKAPVEAMNSDVARHWGTDPETSSKILKTWFRDQAQGASL